VIWDPNWFMPAQAYGFTCSVCSLTWVLQSTDTAHQEDDIYDARYAVGERMGYPDCVNQTYGCMSDQCVIDTLASYGLVARQAYVTFDQAYAIARTCTGTINPQGMYHFMALRGANPDGTIGVANSAPNYCGVDQVLTRERFNALGPVSVIYVESRA
jgi:hypothetical protein